MMVGTDPAAPTFEVLECKGQCDNCNYSGQKVIALHTTVLGLQETLADCDLWFYNGIPLQPWSTEIPFNLGRYFEILNISKF